MTNETTYREKGRSLFLAAMLVLSVVAASAAFAGGAVAATTNSDNYDEGPLFDDAAELDNTGEVWIGQNFSVDTTTTVDGTDETYDVELREGLNPDDDDAEVVVSDSADDQGIVSFETDDLEANRNYHLNYIGADGNVDAPTFEAFEEEYDVEFSSSTVAEEGEADIDFDSERDTQTVNVTSDEYDGEELFNLFEGSSNYDGLYTDADQTGNIDGTALSDGDLHTDEDVLTIVGLDQGDTALTADFSAESASEGDELTFDFESTDSLASDNATVEVTDSAEEREFTDVDSIEEGDKGNITLDVGNSEAAAFSFGSTADNHVVNMTLEDFDDDSDEVILEYNTNNAGSSSDSVTEGYSGPDTSGADTVEATAEDQGWTAHNATITHFYTQTGLDAGETLPASSWDLEVGAHGQAVDSLTDENTIDSAEFVASGDDYGTFSISERSAPSEAVTETAPGGDNAHSFDDYQDATVSETDTIAAVDEDNGDSLFLTVDDYNANGSVSDLADQFDTNGDKFNSQDGDVGATLFEETGISIELVKQDSGAISSDAEWNSSYDADSSVVSDGYEKPDTDLDVDLLSAEDGDYNGNLIFEIDYQEAIDNDNLEVGESYDVNFNVSESESSLTDEDYSSSSEISIEEPEVEWEEVDELPANAEATATGTTNVAPGSDIITKADSPGDEGGFIKDDDANVSDGTFEAVFDLENEQVGSMFDLTAEGPFGEADDEVEDVELVESTDDGDDNESDEEGLGVSASADDITVGDTAEFDVTVENYEDANTTADLTLENADGEEVDTGSVDVNADDDASATLSASDLSEGDHTFTVTADDGEFDDSAEVSLTVNPEDDGSEDEDTGSEDTGSEDTGSEDGDDGEDDDSSSVPGFGVAVALVALLSAAMLALRKQD